MFGSLPSLHGAAWIVGEYSGYLQEDQIANVFASLASPSVMYLDPAIQATQDCCRCLTHSMLQSLLQVTLRFICSLGSGSDRWGPPFSHKT